MNGRLRIYICKKCTSILFLCIQTELLFQVAIPPSLFEISTLSPGLCLCYHTQCQGNGVWVGWPLGFITLSTQLLFLSVDPSNIPKPSGNKKKKKKEPPWCSLSPFTISKTLLGTQEICCCTCPRWRHLGTL